VRETHHPRQVAVRFTHRTIYSHPLSSSFALFRVRRFIAALVFFDLAPIIRYPMLVAVMLKKCFALKSKAVTSHRSPKKVRNPN